MATEQNKSSSAAAKAAQQNLSDLANPLDLAQSANVPRTIDDLANPPGTQDADIPAIARRAGLSGETVRVVLAQGEGEAGKEAQFVRVNEHTWLVPRNTPQVIPVEAYSILNNTLPPVAEGAAAAFVSPRFSVSMLERIPAPRLAA